MQGEQGVHVLWKRLGETPLEAISALRRARPELADAPMTYAGRLDPAAEGTLIVLSDEARFRREEFLSLDKEYEFEALWGVETDTFDMLGVPVTLSDVPEDIGKSVETAAERFIGEIEQAYPPYSSKPVCGKPLFQWAREGRLGEIALPSKKVIVRELSTVGGRAIEREEALSIVKAKAAAVSGNFRQKEIVEAWGMALRSRSGPFFSTKFRAVVSSGTYVRSLVHDIGRAVGAVGSALSIVRTRVGPYSAIGPH